MRFVRLVVVGMVIVLMMVMVKVRVMMVMGTLMNRDGKAIRKMHSGCGWGSRMIGDCRGDFPCDGK